LLILNKFKVLSTNGFFKSNRVDDFDFDFLFLILILHFS